MPPSPTRGSRAGSARYRRSELGGAEIRLVDGHWRFTIQLIDGRSAVVTIDPADGTVEDVQLAADRPPGGPTRTR